MVKWTYSIIIAGLGPRFLKSGCSLQQMQDIVKSIVGLRHKQMWLVAVKYHHLEQATPRFSWAAPTQWAELQGRATTEEPINQVALQQAQYFLGSPWLQSLFRDIYGRETWGTPLLGKALQESPMINRWTEVSKCNLDQDHCAWHTWPGLPGGKASQQTPDCQSERDSTQEGFGCPWLPPTEERTSTLWVRSLADLLPMRLKSPKSWRTLGTELLTAPRNHIQLLHKAIASCRALKKSLQDGS